MLKQQNRGACLLVLALVCVHCVSTPLSLSCLCFVCRQSHYTNHMTKSSPPSSIISDPPNGDESRCGASRAVYTCLSPDPFLPGTRTGARCTRYNKGNSRLNPLQSWFPIPERLLCSSQASIQRSPPWLKRRCLSHSVHQCSIPRLPKDPSSPGRCGKTPGRLSPCGWEPGALLTPMTPLPIFQSRSCPSHTHPPHTRTTGLS